MNIIGQYPFLAALGWALANTLWQMGFLWLIYQLGFAWQKQIKPAYKHGLSLVFLITGTSWFAITYVNRYEQLKYQLSLPFLATDHQGIFSKNAQDWQMNLRSWLTESERFLPYLSTVYLFILSVLLARFVYSYLLVQQLRTQGIQQADPRWEKFLQLACAKWDISRPISIYLSNRLDIPATLGCLKPVILLPVATFNQLSLQQAEAVILHELAHINRNDYISNLLLQGIENLLFFNPFVYLFAREIRKQREWSCDDAVILYQNGDAYAYASALLQLEKMRNSSPNLVMALAGEKKTLLQRVQRIMNVPGEKTIHTDRLLAGILSISLIFLLAWISPEQEIKQQKSKKMVVTEIEKNIEIAVPSQQRIIPLPPPPPPPIAPKAPVTEPQNPIKKEAKQFVEEAPLEEVVINKEEKIEILEEVAPPSFSWEQPAHPEIAFGKEFEHFNSIQQQIESNFIQQNEMLKSLQEQSSSSQRRLLNIERKKNPSTQREVEKRYEFITVPYIQPESRKIIVWL